MVKTGSLAIKIKIKEKSPFQETETFLPQMEKLASKLQHLVFFFLGKKNWVPIGCFRIARGIFGLCNHKLWGYILSSGSHVDKLTKKKKKKEGRRNC